MICKRKKIASTYTYVADGSMKNAANEFIPAQGQGNENIAYNIADITVSNDVSWQKCGHSSLNGVVNCSSQRLWQVGRLSCTYKNF